MVAINSLPKLSTPIGVMSFAEFVAVGRQILDKYRPE